MAAHNQMRIVGYIKDEPTVMGEDGMKTVMLNVRTTHRWTEDCFEHRVFEDVMVYFNDNNDRKLMSRMLEFKKMDLVDIKGVFSVLVLNKPSVCEHCGCRNIKYNGCITVLWPISAIKRGNLEADYLRWKDQCRAYKTLTEEERVEGLMKDPKVDEPIPEKVLTMHFQEISNQVIVIGTLVSEPERLGTEKRPGCRYMLGIDRKYYIRTQSDVTADYPYVYSYGNQALMDLRHLHKGSLVLADAFLRTREVQNNMVCGECGGTYQFQDVAMELIPYSVEYLNNYWTDEDIANYEDEQARIGAGKSLAALGL